MINIKKLRKEANATQPEMANLLSMSLRGYQAIENEINETSYKNLIKLADFFGCSIDYLLGHETSGIIHVDSLSVPEQKLLSYMKQLDADQILRLVGYCEVILGITNTNLKPVRPW